MRIRSSLCALALLALGQLSCATLNLTPEQESMPAARAGLAPQHRIFYDALLDYGDWSLIEPFGYVFRPRGIGVGWRPYQDGYWAFSDIYGWVWVSAEPFGWATYHYGEWLYDDYQGWVWIPGNDWGPAWVTWEQTPDYVGWSPLTPPGYGLRFPDGGFLYVPVAQLGAPDLKTRTRTAQDLGPRLGTPTPVRNLDRQDGVSFNRGPDAKWVESLVGPLQRVKVEDVVQGAAGGVPAAREGARPQRPETRGRRGATRPDSSLVRTIRRGAEESAREAREATERGDPAPASIRILRPAVEPASKPEPAAPRSGDRSRDGRSRGHSAPAPGPADTLVKQEPERR